MRIVPVPPVLAGLRHPARVTMCDSKRLYAPSGTTSGRSALLSLENLHTNYTSSSRPVQPKIR
jgi:hypothetical protein